MDNVDLDLKKQQAELDVQQAEYGIMQFFRTMPKWWMIICIIMIVLIIPGYFIMEYTTSFFELSALTAHSASVHSSINVQLPVKVEQVEAVHISGTSYAAYAQIKNQNSGLSSSSLTYTFHFLDASQNEIGSASGTGFLLAGQEKFIVAPHVNLTQAPSSIAVDINPGTWQNRTDIPNVILTTSTPTRDNVSTGGFEIDGTVLNQSIYTLGTVLVNGFAYDSAGNLLAVIQTTFNAQAPQENRGYRLFWPNSINSEVSSVKVYAETDLLDSTNLQ